jgi:hypothetical protein
MKQLTNLVEALLSPVADFLERHDSVVTRAEDILIFPAVLVYIFVAVMIALPGGKKFTDAYHEVRPNMQRSVYLDSVATARLRHIQRRFVFSHDGATMPECIVAGALMIPREAVITLLGSKPHRELMMDTRYTHFGIADGWFAGVNRPKLTWPLESPVGVGKLYVLVLGKHGNYDIKDDDEHE